MRKFLRNVALLFSVATLGVVGFAGPAAAKTAETSEAASSSKEAKLPWGELMHEWEAAPGVFVHYYRWQEDHLMWSLNVSGSVPAGLTVTGYAPNGFPYQEASATVPRGEDTVGTGYFENTLGLFACVQWPNGNRVCDPNNHG